MYYRINYKNIIMYNKNFFYKNSNLIQMGGNKVEDTDNDKDAESIYDNIEIMNGNENIIDTNYCLEIKDSLLNFIKKWERNELFANQRDRNEIAFLEQRNARLSHDPLHLSKALKIFGKGSMKCYKKYFSKFNFPILIISGDEDLKYTKISQQMIELNQNCKHHSIANSCHNVHLENPKEFLASITSFTKLNK